MTAPPPSASPALDAAFRAERALLWGLAYRMTGLASDADELVQETFLRALEHPAINDGRPLGPWLVRVCVNLARDRLRARRRRERSPVWLPAAIPTDAPTPEDGEAHYGRAESLTLAFLLALEALTPTQRAVLLLCDVFDLDAAEAAARLDTTPGAVRVAHHKARRALAPYDERRVVPAAHTAATAAALQAFFGSLAAGDSAGALALLAPDVELRSDGGAYRAARVPVRGAPKVLQFLASTSRGAAVSRWGIQVLNGLPCLVLELDAPGPGQAPRMMVGIDVGTDGKIQRLFWLIDPQKLGAVPALPR